MKYDSYSRFLKSQMYKDCLVNELEGKPLIQNMPKTNLNVIKKSSNHSSSSLVNGAHAADTISNSSSSMQLNSNTASSSNGGDTLSRKEKKRSTILSWTKGNH
jgi:regulator of G-protein signaling